MIVNHLLGRPAHNHPVLLRVQIIPQRNVVTSDKPEHLLGSQSRRRACLHHRLPVPLHLQPLKASLITPAETSNNRKQVPHGGTKGPPKRSHLQSELNGMNTKCLKPITLFQQHNTQHSLANELRTSKVTTTPTIHVPILPLETLPKPTLDSHKFMFTPIIWGFSEMTTTHATFLQLYRNGQL